jgi:hypothetical protein
MSRACKRLAALLSLPALAAVFAILVPSASASSTATCPSGGTPAPGSTVTGGLEVDGQCFLTGVTVDGGITIDSSAKYFGLVLNSSTVHGGIISNGGELDAGIDFVNGGFTQNTISGGVTLNDPADIDMVNVTVRGGLHVNTGFPACGDQCISVPNFCGNTIYGEVSFNDLSLGAVHFGDPEPDELCGANGLGPNVIHGSLSLTNSNYIIGPPFIPPDQPVESNEIEGNIVTGSVHVNGSTTEVYGNSVGGSLLCSNGSVIFPPLGLDPPGNNVGGANTCF